MPVRREAVQGKEDGSCLEEGSPSEKDSPCHDENNHRRKADDSRRKEGKVSEEDMEEGEGSHTVAKGAPCPEGIAEGRSSRRDLLAMGLERAVEGERGKAF